MRLILIAEPGDYLINVYTKEIKQAMLVSLDGDATVEEFFREESGSPGYVTWDRGEYLVIPNIADVNPSLYEK